jgi:thiol peroxidase
MVGLALSLALISCGTRPAHLVIATGHVPPGSQITKNGEMLTLIGTALEVGQPMPATDLVEASTMNSINLQDYKGSVLFLSIVPSIDTKVCEAQTHYLGEEGDKLSAMVKRITISRDTPFAQKRFATEAGLNDIQYLSDYKEGKFGRSIGLLIDRSRLLARSVVLVDKEGIVQYIQVVPDISNLPDMEKAFARATELAGH